MNVAYIYTTQHFSGSAVSLVEVLTTLAGKVNPTIVSPRGSASSFFARRIERSKVFEVPWLSQLDHTRHGRYRGARWLIALREILLLPVTWFGIRSFAARADDIDLIHLNEITGIAAAVMLKRRLGVPLVVHVRAHMGVQDRGLRSRLLWLLFDRHVDQIICIDETVRATIPVRVRCPVAVVHNALEVALPTNDAKALPQILVDPAHKIRVGVVGSLLRVKGTYEFLEAALRLCARRDDLVFVFVGSGVRRLRGLQGALLARTGLAEDTEQFVRSTIAATRTQERILMLGHRDDLANIYQNLDILCFPSHYNAPGRPIFEAAYFGKPSIVAIDNPRPDTLVDGITGLAIAAKSSDALANAIEKLADDPASRLAMGIAAKELADRNFSLERNAAEILRIYSRLTTSSRGKAFIDTKAA